MKSVMYLFRTALSLKIAHRSAEGLHMGTIYFKMGTSVWTRMQWKESHSIGVLNARRAILSPDVLTVGWWLMQGNLPSPSMHSIRSRVHRRVTEECLAAHPSD